MARLDVNDAHYPSLQLLHSGLRRDGLEISFKKFGGFNKAVKYLVYSTGLCFFYAQYAGADFR